MERTAYEMGVQFWEGYRWLVTEAVFIGTVAAHGCLALAKIGIQKFIEWDKKDPARKK